MAYPEHIADLEAAGWQVVANQATGPIPQPVNPATLPRNFAPLSAPQLKVRMLPPPGGPFRAMTVEGREYSIPKGQGWLDVPIEDARVMAYNGWLDVGPVGPTEARLVQPLRGATFIDTEINTIIIFDGQDWRDMATGMIS